VSGPQLGGSTDGLAERSDRERELPIVALVDDEELLTGLRVARKGAVGKAASPRLVDDVDHPA
jgi:hypothetical protein